MASWMIHFRMADTLLSTCGWRDLPREICAAFVLGNIAPDSGVPNPNGVGYTPNKDTSHFMRVFDGGSDELRDRCDPHGYAAQWLAPALGARDPVAIAFHLGYLTHLVTDNAWLRNVVLPAKETYGHLRLEDGVETPAAVARFYAFLKKDWYDMDFLYIKRHPDLPAYELFLTATDVENRFLPIFPTDAFTRKREEIAAFYRRGAAEVEARKTYMAEAELDGFVSTVREEALKEFGEFFSELTSYSQLEYGSMIQ